MISAHLRGLLLFVAFSISMLNAANGAAIVPLGLHREDVDVSRYPWAAIGKLYNETGASCSGVVISRDKILTAAHCLFNHRTQRFVPAEALHFLVGFRVGRYSVHARIARYEIGVGFDPERYVETSAADWAVLTTTETLPVGIEPLKLSRDASPSGTKAIIAGYPQDRAFAMTADRDCELRGKIENKRLFLNTCRGISGYSGAPILVSAGEGEMRIAGIQIASIQGDGTQSMVAVPAQAIWDQSGPEIGGIAPAADQSGEPANSACVASDKTNGDDSVGLQDISARLDLYQWNLDRLDLARWDLGLWAFDSFDVVSSLPAHPRKSAADPTISFAFGPFAFAMP